VKRLMFVVALLATAPVLTGARPLAEVRALRKERTGQKGRVEVLYRFEEDGDYLTPAAQAARRGKAAAAAWAALDKSSHPLPVVARSPFGGGETSTSYWPKGFKPELLRTLEEPLRKVGLKPIFPELSPRQEAAAAGGGEGSEARAQPPQPKPWPEVGFPQDHEFVLVVGLHHESVPYGGARRRADGSVVYRRSSRVNAWAILFHVPSGCGFWGTTAVARVGHRGRTDPASLAAETALSYLDFAGIGADNIPAYIRKLGEETELSAVDTAALLVQTQRADAVLAVAKAAGSGAAFRNSVHVLRYFNQRGTAQDFRIDPEQAKRRGYVLVSQRVIVRLLLLEQLRGMRSVQACATAALIPRTEDLDVPAIAQQYAWQPGPLGPDDEIVLIAELAESDRRGIFSRNRPQAVRRLGRCRTHIEEAMAVARMYAQRKSPRPRRGRPRRDPLREAGKAALLELNKTKLQMQQQRPNSP